MTDVRDNRRAPAGDAENERDVPVRASDDVDEGGDDRGPNEAVMRTRDEIHDTPDPAARTVVDRPSTTASRRAPSIDAFGALAYLIYAGVGGLLVFGFGWALRGAIEIQNEAICRALAPEYRSVVRVRVVDASGADVPGSLVVPVIAGDVGDAVKPTQTGHFELFFPEGEHRFVISGPSLEPQELEVVVGRGEAISLEFSTVDGSLREVERGRFLADDATLQTLEGREVKLSDYRGKFVVLNFWATFCEPCITEWPHFDRLVSRLGERDDVVVLAVSIDPQREDIEPFLQRMALSDSRVEVLWDPQQSIQQRFGTSNIPDTYFVDQGGNVVHTYVNVRKWGSPEAFHCVDGMTR